MTDLAIRLPSEAEWEYACRAGTRSPFHSGPTISAKVANFNSERPYASASPAGSVRRLSPVGAFGMANEFGLYDMHGNVWEWCADVWHDDYRGAPNNGQPWLDAGDEGYRVQRGGSWRDIPELCRSAFRVGDIAFNWDHRRLTRAPTPVELMALSTTHKGRLCGIARLNLCRYQSTTERFLTISALM